MWKLVKEVAEEIFLVFAMTFAFTVMTGMWTLFLAAFNMPIPVTIIVAMALTVVVMTIPFRNEK